MRVADDIWSVPPNIERGSNEDDSSSERGIIQPWGNWRITYRGIFPVNEVCHREGYDSKDQKS